VRVQAYAFECLPVEIDADKVKAECLDGILALYMPRAEHDKARAIQLRAEQDIGGEHGRTSAGTGSP
jgi:hypothetical protein